MVSAFKYEIHEGKMGTPSFLVSLPFLKEHIDEKKYTFLRSLFSEVSMTSLTVYF